MNKKPKKTVTFLVGDTVHVPVSEFWLAGDEPEVQVFKISAINHKTGEITLDLVDG